MEVDHEGVGVQLLDLLDCLEAIFRHSHDAQLGLTVDQLTQRLEEVPVVVCEHNANAVTAAVAHGGER